MFRQTRRSASARQETYTRLPDISSQKQLLAGFTLIPHSLTDGHKGRRDTHEEPDFHTHNHRLLRRWRLRDHLSGWTNTAVSEFASRSSDPRSWRYCRS